jgi:ribosome-binding ATPase YchF (GTP1/OBG family)
MKVGIVGYSGVGKSTVFQWLTDVAPDPAKVAQQGQVGVARVPDPRLTWLSEKFNPRKTTYATADFLDTPGLLTSEREGNPRRLAILREAGGIVIVLDAFSQGKLAEQLATFRQELAFADLEIVSGRISRLEDQMKKNRPAKEKEALQAELDLLRKINQQLEEEKPVSALAIRPDEEKMIRAFQLLVLKPEVVLVNCGEEAWKSPLPSDLLALAPNALKAAPKLELELAELGDEDRRMFMAEMGFEKLIRDEVLLKIHELMGLQVFFTVGEDECRAWPIPKGADAVVGAGQIHTDLAKRFVRAEVVAYADFVKAGSMKDAKAQGTYRLEGKTYIVQDGDIMHILAST